jgi:hypothetical protein
MSVAAQHDQHLRRSAAIFFGPLVTVNHRARPTYRARSGHGCPRRVPSIHRGAEPCRAEQMVRTQVRAVESIRRVAVSYCCAAVVPIR